MAQQVITKFVDDIDGTEAVGTVTFGLDGKQFEIDLSETNAGRLRDALAEFIGKARKVSAKSRTTGTVTAAKPKVDREQSQAIREWAKANGHQVSDRGRISRDVVAAFHAAH